MIRSVIVGTGSYIPEIIVTNDSFSGSEFYEKNGAKVDKNNKIIIEKFREITGIAERRYAKPEQNASDLAFLSAEDALSSSGIDRESLDYIIVAHNFGDVAYNSNRIDIVPSLASRVKALLKIKNPDCVAYDLPFGCPGWVEGIIQANYFIKSGDVKRCLVIGAETLSRVIDSHDRDSMIFSDGAGAVILEAATGGARGILSHKTQTYATDYTQLLNMDKSYSPACAGNPDIFIKMNGRRVYEFALSFVPVVVTEALNKAGAKLEEIRKVLIHQANDKMDSAIIERLFKMHHQEKVPDGIMPMTIGWLGNSSVATVPTLLDLIRKGKLEGHRINEGDKVVMASVGAGMNINAVVYQF